MREKDAILKRPLQRTVLTVYKLIERTGLLKTRFYESIYVPAYFLYKEYIEDPYAAFCKRYPHLLNQGHILDVGANVGYTATVFEKYLRLNCQVFAFEPEVRNFQALLSMIQRRHLNEKIIPINATVGSKDGFVELWLNPSHPADHRVLTETLKQEAGERPLTQRIKMLTLDSFCTMSVQGPVGFIKIDVQGYEEQVCHGMKETLGRNPKAVVALEYDPEAMNGLGFDSDSIMRFFQDRGYLLYALKRNGVLQRCEAADLPAMISKNNYIDLLFSRSDVN